MPRVDDDDRSRLGERRRRWRGRGSGRRRRSLSGRRSPSRRRGRRDGGELDGDRRSLLAHAERCEAREVEHHARRRAIELPRADAEEIPGTLDGRRRAVECGARKIDVDTRGRVVPRRKHPRHGVHGCGEADVDGGPLGRRYVDALEDRGGAAGRPDRSEQRDGDEQAHRIRCTPPVA